MSRGADLPCISRDGVFFVHFAKHLAIDPVFYMRAERKQPGYAWALLGIYRIIGNHLSANPPIVWQCSGQIISIVGGIAVIPLIFLLTRGLFDAQTALLAAFLTAVWPQCAELAGDVLSDTTHLAIYLAALLLALDGIRRDRLASLALAGLFAGAAYLIRQEAFGLPIAIALTVLRFTKGPRRKALVIGSVLLAFAAPIAPYALAIGEIMHNKTISDLLFGPSDLIGSAARSIHVGLAGEVSGWSAPWEMFLDWCASGIYVISTWAIVSVVWRRVPRGEPIGRTLLLAAAVLQLAASQLRGMSYGVISERYILIPAALSIPWAAAALMTLARRIARQRAKPEIAQASTGVRSRVAAVGLIALLICAMPIRSLRPPPRGSDYMRQAGRWLATHAHSSDRVIGIDRMDRVAFYADLPHAWPGLPGTGPMSLDSPGGWFIDTTDDRRLSAVDRQTLQSLRARIGPTPPDAVFESANEDRLSVYRLSR